MKKYVCQACGYVYDPKAGIPEKAIKPRTSFEKLPESWSCPECGVKKDRFSPADHK
jgi:rubredoxin